MLPLRSLLSFIIVGPLLAEHREHATCRKLSSSRSQLLRYLEVRAAMLAACAIQTSKRAAGQQAAGQVLAAQFRARCQSIEQSDQTITALPALQSVPVLDTPC